MWRKTMHLAVLFACSPVPISTTQQAIVGGSADTTDTSVVAVTIEGGRCSGVMVQSRVVMTAAHCALPAAGRNNVGTVDFAAVVPSANTANIIDVWIDRDYDATTGLHDIALLRIDRDAPAFTVFNANASVFPVTSATLVGYGESAPGLPETYGTRRAITLQVIDDDVTKVQLVALGGPGQSTCTGDSGGAAFVLDEQQNLLVFGVIVSGTDQCDGNVNIDLANDKDLETVLLAWSGPCPADGVCDPSCSFPDPDCDPCAFEGTCTKGCPEVDLDCPVDGLPGATCVENAECESRVCIPDPEGADRGSFYSSACTTAADCAAPLDDCSNGVCVYSGGTPGIPGAACSKDADCRTLLCDDGSHTCAVQCGPDFSCPVGLLCQPVRNARACTAGDACNAGGRGSVASGVAILLAIGISRRRRRLRR